VVVVGVDVVVVVHEAELTHWLWEAQPDGEHPLLWYTCVLAQPPLPQPPLIHGSQ
jgi:hypothetical protein